MRNGAKMIRDDDGKIGEVRQDGEFLRVFYLDRGEVRVADRKEKWSELEGPPNKLRPEEIAEVAATADRCLRAMEEHRPFLAWEKTALMHDAGLVEVVTRYLSNR